MVTVHAAARANDEEALRVLLHEDPGLLNIESDFDGFRPLHCACQAGALNAARILLDRGAGVNMLNDNDETALVLASEAGRADVVGLLLARKGDPSIRDGFNSTALIQAAIGDDQPPASDHVAVIRLLLKDGRAPVNAQNMSGRTALWEACNYGYTERARVLLMEGLADHAIADSSKETPMAVAQRRGREGCVQLLQGYERFVALTKARDVRAIMMAAGGTTAAPAYLMGRVVSGEPLPELVVVGRAGQVVEEEEEEGERCAVLDGLVSGLLIKDLWNELFEGLW